MITSKRKSELFKLVLDEINERDWFHYDNWRLYLKIYQNMTADELAWLNKHCEVIVTLQEHT
ncbi:MAG: hypothetical protein KGL39_13955 [Patescibacteria group bacterium]|nr:hypothetical protein [Patescibacteria group bacterium]